MQADVEVRLGDWMVSTSPRYGPRITQARWRSSPNPLAILPGEVRIEREAGPPYVFHGGHRIWVAPEEPSITYAPDDHEVELDETDSTLVISASADSSGVAKEIEVASEGDALEVRHRLTNRTGEAAAMAAWGITQFRLGGTAILPIESGGGKNEFQASCNLSIWPYTDLTDSRIRLTREAVVIAGEPGPRLKLGSGPDPGRLGYHWDGYLFTKEVTPAWDHRYPDRGAVGQVFVDSHFCELETMGRLELLQPGASTTSVETWRIAECRDLAEAVNTTIGAAS